MTPAEEAEFIRLWTAGMEQVEIARQLGIPRGTVSSRASTLVRQGKIQARPRGGSYPKQKVRQEGSPSTVHHLRWTRYRPPRYHGRSTRLPSTVYRPPRHLGAKTAQAFGPLDYLCPSGPAGGD